MKIKFAILTLLLFLPNFVACEFFAPNEVWPYYEAIITAVIDGDTVKIRFTGGRPSGCAETERVRLIGVNTPELSEPVEYYAQEARNYTNQFWNNPIYIELDSVTGQRDKYGRLLAYIYVNNFCLNEQLILGGYGYYYDYFKFDSQMMYQFEHAERVAKKEKRGLWQ